MIKLPGDFDMLYDIKTLKDLNDVWYDRPTRCRGTRKQLIWLLRHYAIDQDDVIEEKP